MHVIANKWICFLFEFLCTIIQLANSFLTNISIYEASEGVSFDFSKLLSNRTFWLVLVLQIVWIILCVIANRLQAHDDSAVKDAYANGTIALIDHAVDCSKKGDYYSAERTLKILDKLERHLREE